MTKGMMPSFYSGHVPDFVATWQTFRLTDSVRALGDPECQHLAAAYKGFADERRARLDAILAESERLLDPLGDPLRHDLLLPLLLRDKREEVYTSVLKWALERLTVEQALRVLDIKATEVLAGEIFGDRFRIEPEVRILQGARRLDLVVYRGEQSWAVVEVKTRPYSEEDLLKHNDYCAECGDVPRDRLIFMAIKDLDMNLHGFRFLAWEMAVARFRTYAPSIIRSSKIMGALYLAFIGAIEQNLLGFDRSIDHAPEVFDYLHGVLENMEEKHEN